MRSFDEAATRLGVELVLATDRCHVLDDPWRDRAIPIRFGVDEESASVGAVVDAVTERPLDGVLSVGDRPAIIAAAIAEALSLPFSPAPAVRAAGNKLLTRTRFRDAGLPSPWFTPVGRDEATRTLLERVTFPCVVKPLALAASQGVMRADTPDQFETAVARVRSVLDNSNRRARRDPADTEILAEEYLPGREVAVEGVLTDGRLLTFAIFDKPDPLEGPVFEETIYVTPPTLSAESQVGVEQAVARAATALGLTVGPVHAECRINDVGVFVLEVAARPIGGLCSKALRFRGPAGATASLEEVLLRHATRESVAGYQREERASGVMMIPIPRDGLYKRVGGLEEAREVGWVEEITITAKPDQRIRQLPEGASYLGFIFARAPRSNQVIEALRNAHERLTFDIEPAIPLLKPFPGEGRSLAARPTPHRRRSPP
jgi:hypothetical protein